MSHVSRFEFVTQRHRRVAAALELGDGLLLVGAGQPIPLPENTDQTYPFRSHTEYRYLAGGECAGGIVAFDPREGDGGWVSFVPEVSEGERVWEGKTQFPGTPISGFESWLATRNGRPIAMLGTPLPTVAFDAALTLKSRELLTHARRAKDESELELMRQAAIATTAGYAKLRDLLRPGVTERALQIELEAEFFRHGATRTGYGTIVGSGPNSAVLHFEPSSRPIKPGEFVLVDAGAEVDRYVIDVTRTYIAGTPSPFQRDLYQIVLAAEQHAITRCIVGTEWRELHLEIATKMTAGLIELGVMRGDPAALVERGAHTLFFPHGLGHLVGLGVRDAGGTLPGRVKDSRATLRTLRIDLPLEAGYVVTVEPGLYFIPALLNDPKRRELFADCVNWTLVDQQIQIGGVRIEDNVLVTPKGPVILTAAIPKTL
jgi:Xaa-Pro aminopeptidase